MANIDEVKATIARGTKELMRCKSIDNITVTEICEKSGVNRRSFYRYFRDKFEVVDWIYYNDALLVSEHYAGWSIFDYIPRIMASLYKDRKYFANALKYSGQNSFREYCTQQLRNLFLPNFEDAFADEQELNLFIHHVCEMTYDAVIDWLSHEPCMPSDEFSKKYKRFLVTAMGLSYELLTRQVTNKQPQRYIFKEPARQKGNGRK